MLDREAYETEKARLKAERDTQSAIYQGWRDCPICKEAWRTHVQCDTHRNARNRASKARDDLAAFINDNCPAHLRPPSREESMRNRLARWGKKPVWDNQ